MLTIRHLKHYDDDELETARELFVEYAKELDENLRFQSFDEELKDPLKKYGEPGGCLVLAYFDDQPAGCIALQPLKQEGVCEMKRLYVRPQFRKLGIGDQLVKLVLQAGKEKGYVKMVLDTLKKLQAAIKLYTKFGFKATSAYYQNPLEGVVYMERELQERSASITIAVY